MGLNLDFFSQPRLDTADVDHSENEDILMKSPSETEKPTRGRKRGPAANQDDKVQESKPKRGRKKAANTSTDDAEDQWGEDSSMAEASMETEDEQNSPPKKGRRGRPPKSVPSKDEMPSKGRRGRKKAAPPADEENEEEEEEDDEDDAGSENMEVKPKGRRGRKPRLVAVYIYVYMTLIWIVWNWMSWIPTNLLFLTCVFEMVIRRGEAETASDSVESTPQKRRGRPPKSQTAAKKARYTDSWC